MAERVPGVNWGAGIYFGRPIAHFGIIAEKAGVEIPRELQNLIEEARKNGQFQLPTDAQVTC